MVGAQYGLTRLEASSKVPHSLHIVESCVSVNQCLTILWGSPCTDAFNTAHQFTAFFTNHLFREACSRIRFFSVPVVRYCST